MLRTILLIPSIGLCLATSAQYTATVRTSVVNLEKASWNKWSNEHCSIHYPGDWTLGSAGQVGMRTLFLAPADSATAQQNRMEALVLDNEGRSLETIASTGAAELGEQLADVKELGKSLQGDVLVCEYSARLNGTAMRVKRQYRSKGQRVYVLTYMAEPRHYEESLYVADAMFGSFSAQ